MQDCPASGAPGRPLSGLQPGEPRYPAPGPATPSPGPGGAFRRGGDWFGLGGRQAGQALVQPGQLLTSGAVANPGSPGLLGVTGGDLGGCPAEPTLRAGPLRTGARHREGPAPGTQLAWRQLGDADADAVRTERGLGPGAPTLLGPSPRAPRTPGHTDTTAGLVKRFIDVGAGAPGALVAVVLQLVERADAGAALLHDAALLRGPLQAARAGTAHQLQRPHCGETVSQQETPARPARPWSGTLPSHPSPHQPAPDSPPWTGPPLQVTGRLPWAPPAPVATKGHPPKPSAPGLASRRQMPPELPSWEEGALVRRKGGGGKGPLGVILA